MTLQTFQRGGDRIACITLYGDNRHPEVTQWHRRVMCEHFGVPVNYLKCPFPGVSHGQCMDHVLSQTVDTPEAPDIYWWLDNDALVLRLEAIDQLHAKVADRLTLWGQAWNSSHLIGPNGTTQHPYASQACMAFARDLYVALGRPPCNHNHRADTAEELTYAVEENGYTVALQYPSYSATHTTALSQSATYGRGNVYGPEMTYHESRADLDGHVERFVAMAQRVIAGSFLPVVPSHVQPS